MAEPDVGAPVPAQAPALLRRLWRRVERPGLIDCARAQAMADRHERMVAGLPLTELVGRHTGATADVAGPVPIVYVQPGPSPTADPAPRPAPGPADRPAPDARATPGTLDQGAGGQGATPIPPVPVVHARTSPAPAVATPIAPAPAAPGPAVPEPGAPRPVVVARAAAGPGANRSGVDGAGVSGRAGTPQRGTSAVPLVHADPPRVFAAASGDGSGPARPARDADPARGDPARGEPARGEPARGEPAPRTASAPGGPGPDAAGPGAAGPGAAAPVAPRPVRPRSPGAGMSLAGAPPAGPARVRPAAPPSPLPAAGVPPAGQARAAGAVNGALTGPRLDQPLTLVDLATARTPGEGGVGAPSPVPAAPPPPGRTSDGRRGPSSHAAGDVGGAGSLGGAGDLGRAAGPDGAGRLRPSGPVQHRQPAPVDVEHIVDAVHRRFVRRLAIEAERRGVR